MTTTACHHAEPTPEADVDVVRQRLGEAAAAAFDRENRVRRFHRAATFGGRHAVEAGGCGLAAQELAARFHRTTGSPLLGG